MRILELLEAMSKRQLCIRSGVDYATVTHIVSGASPRRVLDRTKRRIMDCVPGRDPWCYIDATRTQRIVTRLHRQGYSYGFIADSTGLSASAVRNIAAHTYVRAWVADAIKDFADFVGRSPGVARDLRPNGRRALSNEQRRKGVAA